MLQGQESSKVNGLIAVSYTSTNPELGRAIVDKLGIQGSYIELITKKFADGEVCVEYERTIRGKDLFLISPICPPNVNDSLIETVLAVDAAKRASANRITLCAPYLGYARQDRKAAPRQPISARVIADILSTCGVDRIINIDIHVQQIQGFYSSRVPLDFLPGTVVFMPKMKELMNEKKRTVVSCDVGGAARCRSLAEKLGTDLVIVDKRRQVANQSEVMNIIGDVKGKDLIIYDDIIDTAGSVCHGVEALKKAGAKSVVAFISHGLLSGPAIERLNKSELDKLYITDSCYLSEEKKAIKCLEIISCADVLVNAIKVCHYEGSIADMIEDLGACKV